MFASMLGFIVGMFVLSFLFIAIIAGIAATFSKPENTHIKDKSVLRLDLSYEIAEQTDENPFRDFSFTSFELNTKAGLNDILANIKKAKDDDRIKGIYLDFGTFPNGAGTASQIRTALQDFRSNGKWVIAYADLMTQKAYYVATAADKVYVNPKGLIEFRGLNAQIIFFKNLLDKIGVEPQVFYVGKFKTATEPFRYDKMSEPNRVMTLDLISHIQDRYTEEIAAARKLDVALVDSISDNLLIKFPSDALRLKMIDGTYYRDQVIDEMKQRLGVKEDEKIAFINMDKMDNVHPKDKPSLKDAKIAVLYASGSIVDGKGEDDEIGSVTLVKELEKLRADDKIKAVVFRVNSGGGSALASDVIWRAVGRVKEKKPIVVSMGDYAASGGYYISANASKIVALPNTLTGSIGVFGILPNAQKLMNEKLGITFDNVQTGKHSDLGSIVRPVTSEEAMIIQSGVDSVYLDFITVVSKGRNIPLNMVDSIAQGRVWTGTQALEIGLVDTLGDLNTAISIAAKLAKLDKYRTTDYPEAEDDDWKQIIKAFKDNEEDEAVREHLGMLYPYFEQLKLITTLNGVQARMPYNVTID